MKDLLVFLADGFEEIEALTVVDICRRAGLKVDTVSITDRYEVRGTHDVKVISDKNFDEINIEDYKAMYIPGGQPGATNLKKDKKVVECANLFNDEEKKIIAICAGPQVLDAANLLKENKFTCYPGVEESLKVKNPLDEAVVEDENIVTAMGPALAMLLGIKVVEILDSKEKAKEVAEGLLLPELKKFI
ncbi:MULTISPECIES: DJ-1 family glyoxalase III [Peptoniphilus]|jgi:DJ-1 family protein|uniref:DJ-1 family glyoxalase III n=1 Tax=Peptoniphilus TaxID=162289 RepID=UPI000287D9A0|nr:MULTISPECIES: DJ-1 family glyoxalase III [Peptoniphilus]MBS6610504.1 DJ-1/PfpI family protein [Peptoniphilus harei]MDU5377469.1 DJ-1/PfpI family protein [Peptoniphilus lacydonensis]MDU5436286.1 DJ-1/PfpI family protein [Peptoniphilus lacydonensis]MDU5594646.1 DJ-1/PfpI family protein [Peptoniphilus rhinitidis]MDU7302056.1 DJ-1/PfpI family protein [Peptoniphilus lacydonensis]